MTKENKMTKGGNDVTKEEWKAYRDIQDGALYNMYTPEAVRASGLDK